MSDLFFTIEISSFLSPFYKNPPHFFCRKKFTNNAKFRPFLNNSIVSQFLILLSLIWVLFTLRSILINIFIYIFLSLLASKEIIVQFINLQLAVIQPLITRGGALTPLFLTLYLSHSTCPTHGLQSGSHLENPLK